eukprot:15437120-Alexandrium_andersonii.AAC.1
MATAAAMPSCVARVASGVPGTGTPMGVAGAARCEAAAAAAWRSQQPGPARLRAAWPVPAPPASAWRPPMVAGRRGQPLVRWRQQAGR